MITRHFYKEDEVLAALQWCLVKGRVREAVFWAKELIDSNMGVDTFMCLIHSWMLSKGVRCIRWLRDALEIWNGGQFTEEEILLLVYKLVALPKTARDVTPMTLLFLSFKETPVEPDRLLPTVMPTTACKGATRWEDGVHGAVEQRRVELLWFLLRSEWETNADYIESILQIAATGERQTALQNFTVLESIIDPDASTWFIRALKVAMICMSDSDLKKSLSCLKRSIPDDLQKDMQSWEDLMGRRERRAFPIPRDCLYWVTERGTMTHYQSTLDEIKDLTSYLELNNFWSEALELRSYEDMSLAERVEFAELYFPDGHPMVWPRAELEKSHGGGVLRETEEILLSKFLRIWFADTSLIWKGWSRALSVVANYEKTNTIEFIHNRFNALCAEAQPKWHEEMKGWNLNPAQRIYVKPSEI